MCGCSMLVDPKVHEDRLYERLLNRSVGSAALLVSDKGKYKTALLRRIRHHTPVASQFGGWPDRASYRNVPVEHIIEDIVFRDSRRSYFIQLADFCAYALYHSEYPHQTSAKMGRYQLD